MTGWWLLLLERARPHWRGVLAILIVMLAGTGIGLLTPWPLKLIVDHVLAQAALPGRLAWIESLPGAGSRQGLLIWLAAATVGLFLVRRGFAILASYLEVGVGSRMVYGLGADLFESLQRYSLRFHSERSKGDLIRRVTDDASCVRELSLSVALPLIVSLTDLVAMFAVMWQLSRPLALVAVSIAAPLGFAVKTFARPMSESKYEKKRLQGEMTSLAEQALSAVPLVQGFGQEEQEDDRFQRVSRRTADASLRVTRVQLQFKIVTGLVTALATAAVMVIGGLQVLHGSLTVGALLVLLYYFGALYSPLETIAYLSDGLASASAGARRVMEILGSGTDTIRDDPDARELEPPAGGSGAAIRFEAVTFGYEPDRPVLRQVTLSVRPGEVVALVGPTGVGKSTLLSLIPRFFDPCEGAVLVNGQDVRGVRLSSLRAQIAVVFQEPFLFPLSVADNIAYGRPGAGRDEIIAAATAARAHEFIERLPEGYDTVIGERGATLSGGEKQRLAIARALLKDAPILLLDEPTSALDAFTESSLMQALEELMRGRTTIIIAHRLSTIRNADRVLALEGGRIVEQGKPPGLHRTADR